MINTDTTQNNTTTTTKHTHTHRESLFAFFQKANFEYTYDFTCISSILLVKAAPLEVSLQEKMRADQL